MRNVQLDRMEGDVCAYAEDLESVSKKHDVNGVVSRRRSHQLCHREDVRIQDRTTNISLLLQTRLHCQTGWRGGSGMFRDCRLERLCSLFPRLTYTPTQ